MAQELLDINPESRQLDHARTLTEVEVRYGSRADFKRRVPTAVGLIRTADTTPYANVILLSG